MRPWESVDDNYSVCFSNPEEAENKEKGEYLKKYQIPYVIEE
jgi:hypothetical protein